MLKCALYSRMGVLLGPSLLSITHVEYPLSKCLGPEVLQRLDFFQRWSIYTDIMSYLGDETEV